MTHVGVMKKAFVLELVNALDPDDILGSYSNSKEMGISLNTKK